MHHEIGELGSDPFTVVAPDDAGRPEHGPFVLIDEQGTPYGVAGEDGRVLPVAVAPSTATLDELVKSAVGFIFLEEKEIPGIVLLGEDGRVEAFVSRRRAARTLELVRFDGTRAAFENGGPSPQGKPETVLPGVNVRCACGAVNSFDYYAPSRGGACWKGHALRAWSGGV
ncbi:hypothetical protein [Actinocorallia aurantiaca]|uniref:Uncharacterized protein n=1 Tax=Actinocorallia aurantiaca TaxID=46204 RepID=A0ABN3U9U7_9ACTN